MYASLLALPLLAPVIMGHTIPRNNRAHGIRDTNQHSDLNERAMRDAAAVFALAGKRSIPKAHFGFPPSAANIKSSPGFQKRDEGDRMGMRKIRRRKVTKKACTPKQVPNSVPTVVTSSIGAGLYATVSSVSASSAVSTSSAVSASSAAASSFATSSSAVTSSASAEASTTSYVSTTSSYASTTSSSAAQASQSSSSGLTGLMAYVFPRGEGTARWTTVTDQSTSMDFNSALKPLQAGKLPDSGTAPDGSAALVADFPAGTVKLASGQGYSFYTAGDHAGVSITGAKEVVFSYSVFFQDGFQFAKGGKLPGLYGGTSLETAKSCSGGRQDGRDECFSARLMWRTNGAGEIYNYLPSKAYENGNYCSTAPFSKCDPNYGESIARGAFTFPTGKWTTLAIRLKMNDANVANGEQELFVNGESVINLTELMISVNSETKIYGIMAQTFFGGSDNSWASPIDQKAYFKDWSLAVLA